MPPSKPLRRRHWIVRGALVAIFLVVACGFGASQVSTGDYSVTPGGAEPVAPLITIDGKQGTNNSGHILLTDVYLTPLSWLTYLPAWFNSDAEIVSGDALVTPGVSVNDLDIQGYLQMAQSKTNAQAAAFQRLGYPVTSTNDGALVEAVGTSTPASGQISVADIVVGVNGQATTTACAVIAVTRNLLPGSTASFQIKKASISDNGTITNGSPVVVNVTVGKPPTATQPSPCPGVSGPAKGFLGIALQDDIHYVFPFSVNISTPNIGGPSAGLAMTLGIIDQLSNGTLIHHRTIGATGTMSPGGAVGDVGGVPQKAVAVSNAGATMFLVPGTEKKAAQSTAASSLQIVAVDTLNQALKILMAGGGTITMANGSIER